MLDRGEVLGGAQLGNKILKGLISEMSTVFGGYRLWNYESSEDVSFVEAGEVLGCNLARA